jgi:Xaa-Pro aminopeptidase
MTDTMRDGTRREAGRNRIAAVSRKVAEQELDLVLVVGSGRHHFLGENLCWWLSGTRQVGRDAVVAVTREGEAVLITTPSWDANRARRRGWIDDVIGVDDLAAELPRIVRERGWAGARGGVASSQSASAALNAALPQAFAGTPVAADALVHEVAKIHDAYALSLIERAVQIADVGYQRLLESARPGVREFEMHAESDAQMRALGADDNFLLISASQHNRAVHAPTGRELGIGDVVLGEISPSVDGQFAQICRSAVIGEPNQRQLEAYAVLQEAYQAGLAACGPGVAVADVTRVINDVIAGYGYEQYNRPPYMRTRGHSMGLGAMVPADISERSDVVLEPGMSFVLHPNQYFPGPGYFLCGDQVVITADGARVVGDGVARLDTIEAEVLA